MAPQELAVWAGDNINDFESSLVKSTWLHVQILTFLLYHLEQTMEYALAGHCASLDPGHVMF